LHYKLKQIPRCSCGLFRFHTEILIYSNVYPYSLSDVALSSEMVLRPTTRLWSLCIRNDS